jgi:hypothetical protein
MLSLLNGMITMGFVVAAMLFLRFWRRTHDPLFATFAAAFLLLALNQFLIGLSPVPSEDRSLLYLPRLAAFALIIVAIIWKNIAGRRSGQP